MKTIYLAGSLLLGRGRVFLPGFSGVLPVTVGYASSHANTL